MGKACDGCGSKCCTYFCFQIDTPDDFGEFEDIRWFLCHEGVSVHVDEKGDWYISIANRCGKLDARGRCTIYDDRPVICRKYPPDQCDRTMRDYGYAELFETPEQVEAHAKKVLGAKAFEKARKKARRKAEGNKKKGEKKPGGAKDKRKK